MAEDVPARVERFLASFVAPLLAGGAALVSRPHGAVFLDYAAVARPSDAEVDAALHAAFHHAASAVAPIATIPYPDRGAVALALAGHDLLAITDPLLDRWGSRRAVPRMLELVEDLVDAAGAPATRGEALVRHAVVSRLFRLERRDVVVKNWAYTYRFFGREVPGNVVALPKLRRVRSTETMQGVRDLLRATESRWSVPIARVVRKLVAASPLTSLLEPELAEPFRIGTGEASVLADPSLRRAVARRLSAEGDVVVARYAAAVVAPELAVLPQEARAGVGRLFAELGAEDVLDRRAGRVLDGLVRGQPGVQVLAGLFVAGLEANDLAAGLDAHDADAVRAKAAAVRAALPPHALARAHRIVGVVDESRSIPLEDAS